MKFLYARRTVLMIWMAWVVIMIGYQFWVQARFTPERPDYALSWTEHETLEDSNDDNYHLTDPFLQQHIAWDSEYYLSIAIGGYDDPPMRAIPENYDWGRPRVGTNEQNPSWVSMNYAFFPFYPTMMRVVTVPLGIFGMNDLATATLAGVIVSMLGTLGAMIALHDITKDHLGESGGVRTAFYLLIFPAGMFLGQVYTEGLFLGLSFGTLALARREKWVYAAILAACATWTRAAGGLLIVPLGLYWIQFGGLKRLFIERSLKEILTLLVIASPLYAYFIWNLANGEQFHIIEERWFGRGLLHIQESIDSWKDAWELVKQEGYKNALAYHAIELGATILGFITALIFVRRYPILTIYGLMSITFALTSGDVQGMHRYVMASPLLFIMPAHWGKSEAFDRSWTLLNILLMGMFVALFSFDFWAG